MLYTIYKITNKITGDIYIGKHQTNNLDDNYFGSGVYLRRAIAKYGFYSFVKEVLFVFDSEKEMNLKEKEIVNETFVNRPDTYNIGVGGEGGPHFKGKTHTREDIDKMLKSRGKIELSIESRKKISDSLIGRTLSQDTKDKISITILMRNGRTLEEATKLIKDKKSKVRMSKSEATTKYFSNITNRIKLSEKMTVIPSKYDIQSIKNDYVNGIRPKDIMAKYNLTKNKFDYIRARYIVSEKITGVS